MSAEYLANLTSAYLINLLEELKKLEEPERTDGYIKRALVYRWPIYVDVEEWIQKMLDALKDGKQKYDDLLKNAIELEKRNYRHNLAASTLEAHWADWERKNDLELMRRVK